MTGLQRNTKYQQYDAREPYIKTFWSIVHGWPPAKQRGLLKFVTAAERIPVTGFANVTFIISKSNFGDPEVGLQMMTSL